MAPPNCTFFQRQFIAAQFLACEKLYARFLDKP